MKRIMSLALAVTFVLAAQALWADDAMTNSKDATAATPAMSATPMATPAMKAKKKKKKQAMKTVWECPMGDYSGPKTADGKCPNCHMDLVKKEVPADSVSTPGKMDKTN